MLTKIALKLLLRHDSCWLEETNSSNSCLLQQIFVHNVDFMQFMVIFLILKTFCVGLLFDVQYKDFVLEYNHWCRVCFKPSRVGNCTMLVSHFGLQTFFFTLSHLCLKFELCPSTDREIHPVLWPFPPVDPGIPILRRCPSAAHAVLLSLYPTLSHLNAPIMPLSPRKPSLHYPFIYLCCLTPPKSPLNPHICHHWPTSQHIRS